MLLFIDDDYDDKEENEDKEVNDDYDSRDSDKVVKIILDYKISTLWYLCF